MQLNLLLPFDPPPQLAEIHIASVQWRYFHSEESGVLEEAKIYEHARLNLKAWMEWVYNFSTLLCINPGRDQLEV